MRVVVSTDLDEVRRLRDEGYCPVECSFGDVSLVDELRMDHHGPLAALEPVSIRAWRDHHGARREDQRFVVAGTLDADAAFAIAALAGAVPGPTEAGGERAGLLAALIARMDVDPIGLDVSEVPVFGYRRIWTDLFDQGHGQDAVAAVLAFGPLCRVDEQRVGPYLAAAVGTEQRRMASADEDYVASRTPFSDHRVLVLNEVSRWGFDRWYGRDPDLEPQDPAAWRHPVVLVRSSKAVITVGCPNQQVAEALFGPGGLQAVFPRLEPAGWGGRESIGGSPRGVEMDARQLVAAAEQVAAMMSS